MVHSNIIIQKLDILAVFNAINDGQLYILRDHKLYFRKKCILSLTIDCVLANSVDSDQMGIWVCTVCQNTPIVDKGILMSANNLVVLFTLPTLKPIK